MPTPTSKSGTLLAAMDSNHARLEPHGTTQNKCKTANTPFEALTLKMLCAGQTEFQDPPPVPKELNHIKPACDLQGLLISGT